MLERNVISWNAIITGYPHNGQNDVSLKLVIEMQSGDIQLDDFTFLSAMCASLEMLLLLCMQNMGEQMMHPKFFKEWPKKDVVSWIAMISWYAENGRIEDAHKCP